MCTGSRCSPSIITHFTSLHFTTTLYTKLTLTKNVCFAVNKLSNKAAVRLTVRVCVRAVSGGSFCACASTHTNGGGKTRGLRTAPRALIYVLRHHVKPCHHDNVHGRSQWGPGCVEPRPLSFFASSVRNYEVSEQAVRKNLCTPTSNNKIVFTFTDVPSFSQVTKMLK